MTIQEVKTICVNTFAIVGLEFKDIIVLANGRLTRTLGRCCYERKCGKVVPVRLEFSRQLLETATAQSITDVILHECAHAIAAIETGESQGHNKYFKNVCARIGTDNDGTKTKVESTISDTQLYKYFIVCKGCGEVLGKYHRAGKVIKNIDDYSCPHCNHKLSVLQNF